jgi:hypothetical protein
MVALFAGEVMVASRTAATVTFTGAETIELFDAELLSIASAVMMYEPGLPGVHAIE